ncbi:MAG: histidinol-phosphate aminotransferase family protein [Mycoplasmatales bacterium]|nr:histidinol-phosphate aminotransferase family protein [Mycoplasmatales bacterium]
MFIFKKEFNFKRVIAIDDMGEIQKLTKKPLIKLSRNENIYGPSPKIFDALNNIKKEDVIFYPRLNTNLFHEQIAKNNGIDQQNLFASSGSDDFIYFFGKSILSQGDNVVIFDNTFRSYYTSFEQMGAEMNQVKHDENYQYNLRKMVNQVNDKTKIIVIVNPNMPTGQYFAFKDMLYVIKNTPPNVLIIIDFAYIEFVEATFTNEMLKELITHKNVVVTRTLSKMYALAGLRIGYIMADKEMISLIKSNIRRLSVSKPSYKIAYQAIKDTDYYDEIKSKVIKSREWTQSEMKSIGLPFVPSQGNFIYVPVDDQWTEKIWIELIKREGILIRKYGGGMGLRITIGTQKQMESIMGVIKDVWNK